MWKIQIFILFILTACLSPDKRIKEEENTKIFILKQLFITQHQYDSIKTLLIKSTEDKAEALERLQHYIDENNSVIEMTLNYKESIIKSHYLEDKMNDVLEQKNQLFKQAEDVRRKNDGLIKENEGMRHDLISEQLAKENVIKEKKVVEKQLLLASELNISAISIRGVGSSLFSKKELDTNKASRIKRIKIAFTFPTNPAAEKESKKIAVFMYSTNKIDYIEKDTTIYYMGKESNINMRLVGAEFKAGKHHVVIKVNNAIKNEQDFWVIN